MRNLNVTLTMIGLFFISSLAYGQQTVGEPGQQPETKQVEFSNLRKQIEISLGGLKIFDRLHHHTGISAEIRWNTYFLPDFGTTASLRWEEHSGASPGVEVDGLLTSMKFGVFKVVPFPSGNGSFVLHAETGFLNTHRHKTVLLTRRHYFKSDIVYAASGGGKITVPFDNEITFTAGVTVDYARGRGAYDTLIGKSDDISGLNSFALRGFLGLAVDL